ncbi:hypothetical protein Tco_0554854 [Tanacetum coccineum]
MRREMSDMQAELLALREPQRRARQPGPEARIPDHQEASGDADSHIMVVAVENNLSLPPATRLWLPIDMLEWSDMNLKVQGICQDLECTLKKKIRDKYVPSFVPMKLRVTSTSVDILTTFYWDSQSPAKPKELDETMRLANDLMDLETPHERERQSANKRKG